MSCDICGKVGSELVELIDAYKTADVHHVCPDCERVLNKQSHKLLSVVMRIKAEWMKRFITERRGKR